MFFSAVSTWLTSVGGSCLEEIWNVVALGADLLDLGVRGAGAELTIELTGAVLAGRCRCAVIRVPEVKSIPRFSPRPPIASAPISRITPDIEKK